MLPTAGRPAIAEASRAADSRGSGECLSGRRRNLRTTPARQTSERVLDKVLHQERPADAQQVPSHAEASQVERGEP